MKFLDSNILIYAADETDLAKFGKACDIVDAAVRGNGFMISAQVLNDGQLYCGIMAVNPFK